jgi:NAD(P)-dependent dehydrogenase (short-subunit alcohol dehydrogenase family)
LELLWLPPELKARTTRIWSGGMPKNFLSCCVAKDHLNSVIPMKRMGEPIERTKTVLFLASDDSSFITGTEIVVDGGMVEI